MPLRSVMRYVPHTIRHDPEHGITAQLFCTARGCGESLPGAFVGVARPAGSSAILTA